MTIRANGVSEVQFEYKQPATVKSADSADEIKTVDGGSPIGAGDELSPQFQTTSHFSVAQRNQLKQYAAKMNNAAKKLENSPPPEWDPDEGRYDNISYQIDHQEDYDIYDEALANAKEILGTLELDDFTDATEKQLYIDIQDARVRFSNARQKSILNQKIKDLEAHSSQKYHVYDFDDALRVRDNIINELSPDNLTLTERIILDMADEIIQSKSTVGDYLKKNKINLTAANRKALEQVCNELTRNNPDDRVPFSMKEEIYIVKNAFNDFGLKENHSKVSVKKLIDTAVREHLYYREKNDDKFYTHDRIVNRRKNYSLNVQNY